MREPTEIDGALYGLRMSISDLWKQRLAGETADDVLREEGAILSALASLSALAEDIRKANDNHKLQAAE